jgi:hypothetical protein
MIYAPSIVIATVLVLGCSSQEKAGPQKIEESRLVSTSATVEAINQKTRMVTLRGPHGDLSTVKCGDSVKNLDQIKVGDRVVADYYESVAVQVIKPKTAESGQEMVVEAAEPGQMPAGAAAEKTTLVATVERIDRAAPSITLKDSEGTLTTIRVQHPERLDLVKVGETLKITFTAAVAIAVEPPQKSAK